MSIKLKYSNGDKLGLCTFLNETESIIYPKTEFNRGQTIVRRALFKCSCGNEFIASIREVKNKSVVSCGCMKHLRCKELAKNNKTHGQWYHPIYKIWNGMINRCNNSTNKYYINYGGRGIKICERWYDINNFIEDMYSSYIVGLEIDRINNDGNYELSNCRWVTKKQNLNNKRSNRIIEYNNDRKTVSQWSDHLGIPYKTLMTRLSKWGTDDAFSIRYPIYGNRYKNTISCK